MEEQGKVEEVSEFDNDVDRFTSELQMARTEVAEFESNGQEATDRYKDKQIIDRTKTGGARYNLFWSNVQTLQPALYSRRPKPQVERRFKDKDPVGRVASQVLERATAFIIDSYDSFDSVMKRTRDDYLIVGRGVAWVRYVPEYSETGGERMELQVSEDDTGNSIYSHSDGSAVPSEIEILADDKGSFYNTPVEQDVVYQKVECDYVHWRDFLHSPARTWEEVRWVARRSFMTRQELRTRFKKSLEKLGFDVEEVPLDHTPSSVEDEPEHKKELFSKSSVWEIWDKETKKVYWINTKFQEAPLDVKTDPLRLTNFFPCPEPLLATTTNDNLVPICDYVQYKDQARAIDELTTRLNRVTEMIKISGVADNRYKDQLRKVVTQSDNTLEVLDGFSAFAEKGGLKGIMELMDITPYVEAASSLINLREQEKANAYEITGMSDIIRGNSSPNETATAQQIKGQFASMRLTDRQANIQRFARDLIGLVAEIIAEHFDPQLIGMMAGVQNMNEEAQALFPQAVQLFKNDVLRTFRVDIETDSTVALDEKLDRQNANEYLDAISKFLAIAMPAGTQEPDMIPMLGESLMFLARRYKVGRGMEATIEQFLDKMEEKAQAAASQPQQPSEEQMKAQFKIQEQQMKAQLKEKELALKADYDMQERNLEFKQRMVLLEKENENEMLKMQIDLLKKGDAEGSSKGKSSASSQPLHINVTNGAPTNRIVQKAQDVNGNTFWRVVDEAETTQAITDAAFTDTKGQGRAGILEEL